MKKMKKKTLALLMSAILAISILLSGCSLITVNPERDSAQTLMTIGDEVITKSVFNNYMAYVEMYYTSAGSSMPTGSDLTELKNSILDSVVQIQILAAKGRKDQLSVDESAAKQTGEENYNDMKSDAGSKYNSILSNWNTNDESFKNYMIQNAVDTEYAEAAETAFKDNVKNNPDDYLNQSVGTVNDKDVTRGEYNYAYIGAYINAYTTSGSALDTTDEDVMKETNTEIFKGIGLDRDLIQYCEDNSIEIKEDAVTTAKTALQTAMSYYFEDDASLEEYTDSFNLTLSKYKSYQEQEAKADAAADAIKEKMISDVEVSDSDIKSYYNKNKDTYDTSTVSACHILTEDEDLANEIYKAAKDCKSKEDFEAVMKTYEDNENVSEATDLGAFVRTKMVDEFSDTAFSMEVNTVSKPVESEYGYHVIFVYDKNEVEDSWENHKDEIKTTIQKEEGEEAYTEFEEKLEKQQKPSFGDIKIGIESYVETLKSELDVTVYEKVIR